MRNIAFVSGIAVAMLLILGLRKTGESAIMEEKVHKLQDKFKSLDAA